jgi:hypothetical protein
VTGFRAVDAEAGLRGPWEEWRTQMVASDIEGHGARRGFGVRPGRAEEYGIELAIDRRCGLVHVC